MKHILRFLLYTSIAFIGFQFGLVKGKSTVKIIKDEEVFELEEADCPPYRIKQAEANRIKGGPLQ